MENRNNIIGIVLNAIVFLFAQIAFSQTVKFDFSGKTKEENKISIREVGFGMLPLADVSFGKIPTDANNPGATDGRGMIVAADPGEGAMVYFPPVITTHPVLIRCYVRTTNSDSSVYLASIDLGKNVFVSTITPNYGRFFDEKYQRLSFVVTSSSNIGIQPILQIADFTEPDVLMAYVDNVEIIVMESGKYYSEAFINGGDIDPYSVSADDCPSIPIQPTPTPVSISTDNLPQEITIDIPNLQADATPLEMVLIPSGSFIMGSPETEIDRDDDETQHPVTITKPFYLGKYEITNAQWNSMLNIKELLPAGNRNLPKVNITWDDSLAFIQQLNLTKQRSFRLPTEAEWEYACRAGTTTSYYWGDNANDDEELNRKYAVYSCDGGGCESKKAGSKLPNPCGIYDMSGNVSEWCLNWYYPYPNILEVNPFGPPIGESHVARGGFFFGYSYQMRSAKRDFNMPDNASAIVGFRILKEVE